MVSAKPPEIFQDFSRGRDTPTKCPGFLPVWWNNEDLKQSANSFVSLLQFLLQPLVPRTTLLGTCSWGLLSVFWAWSKDESESLWLLRSRMVYSALRFFRVPQAFLKTSTEYVQLSLQRPRRTGLTRSDLVEGPSAHSFVHLKDQLVTGCRVEVHISCWKRPLPWRFQERCVLFFLSMEHDCQDLHFSTSTLPRAPDCPLHNAHKHILD